MSRRAKHKPGRLKKPGASHAAEPSGGTSQEALDPTSRERVSTVDKVIWAVLLLVIYAVVATWGHLDFSNLMGYYDLFADALLQGRLHLDVRPDQIYIHDMVPFEGRYYIQWGPVLALPYVFAKLAGFPLSDRITCLLTGWLTSLVFFGIVLTLRQRHFPEVSKDAVRWFFFAFALATPTTLVALRGTAYHESIAVGALMVIAAFWALLRYQERFTASWAFACGSFIALAMMTRITLTLYGLVLFGFFAAMQYLRRPARGITVAHLTAYTLPLLAAGLLQMAYNDARFGSAWDYGNTYLTDATGQAPFKLSRVPENAMHYLLAPPTVSSDFPWIEHVGWRPRVETLRAEDMSSLFIMSPFVLLAGLCVLLWRRPSERRELQLFVAIALAASSAMFLVLLTFASASRRYMQDFVPIWMVLAFVGVGAYLGRTALPRFWKPAAWALLACSMLLHLHLLFTMPFNWDPPDINVMRTFVSWSGTVRKALPGRRLDREEAMIRNDMSTLALQRGLYQDAVDHLKIARKLMPGERRIKQNLELAERFLAQQTAQRQAPSP